MVSRVTAALATVLVATAVVAAPATDSATVTIRGGGLTLAFSRTTGQPAGGGLTVTEGPQVSPVAWGVADRWQVTSSSASCVRRDPHGLELTQRLSGGQGLAIALTFANRGTKQRLLEVRYAVPQAGSDLKWWDGLVEAPPRPPRVAGLSTTLRFPLSAVYGDQAGVAVGVDPHFMLSAFATGAEPVAGGLTAVFAARIVVDPAQTLTLPLHAFGQVTLRW